MCKRGRGMRGRGRECIFSQFFPFFDDFFTTHSPSPCIAQGALWREGIYDDNLVVECYLFAEVSLSFSSLLFHFSLSLSPSSSLPLSPLLPCSHSSLTLTSLLLPPSLSPTLPPAPEPASLPPCEDGVQLLLLRCAMLGAVAGHAGALLPPAHRHTGGRYHMGNGAAASRGSDRRDDLSVVYRCGDRFSILGGIYLLFVLTLKVVTRYIEGVTSS